MGWEMVLSLSLRKQKENPWGLSHPALTAAVHSAEGTGPPSTPTTHRVGLCPSLHGLTQVSADLVQIPLGPLLGPLLLSPSMCSSCTGIQSQLDTALPTALSSLRAIRINDFQAQSTSLWASGDCEGEGPTSRPLLPALPGPTGGRVCVLSQGVFKSRA